MQGKGQPLISTLLLLLPLLSVLAHKTDDRPSHFSKRSVSDVTDGERSWKAPPSSSSDDITAAKRFNEFVGKRAQGLAVEPTGKRMPYEMLYRRFLDEKNIGDSPAKADRRSSQYEFVGKRPLFPPVSKPALVAGVSGKRVQLPYEFLGKRIFGSSWEQVSAKTVEDDTLIKEVTDILSKRDREDLKTDAQGHQAKRYAEWLGKRGGPIADQLLRDLVNKRISAMMRDRLQNNANPEFIGRREEDDMPLSEEQDLNKRYTEFIGK